MASKVRIIQNLWLIIYFFDSFILVNLSSIMIDLEHYWKIRGWSCYSWGWKLCEYVREKRICEGWQLHPWILCRASSCSDTTCRRICSSRRRYHADFFLLLKRYWHPRRMQLNCKYSVPIPVFIFIPVLVQRDKPSIMWHCTHYSQKTWNYCGWGNCKNQCL